MTVNRTAASTSGSDRPDACASSQTASIDIRCTPKAMHMMLMPDRTSEQNAMWEGYASFPTHAV